MRKFFKKIHIWLSAPACIVIFLMCSTGAILVFQEEILRTMHPERYTVRDHSSAVIPLDDLIDMVNKNLVGDTVTAMQIFHDPAKIYVATLASGARSHAYIDPYTAEIRGYYNYREGFFFNVTQLHRWLMFKNRPVGKMITGISTVFLVFILISGVVVWMPRRGVSKKSFFRISAKNRKRLIFDLHRVLGIYACIFLMIMALTGLMWSFQWYRTGVSKLFGIEQPIDNQSHGGGGRQGRGGDRSGREDSREGSERIEHSTIWQTAMEVAITELDDYEYIRIAKNGNITVLSSKAHHPRATDTYRYDRHQNKLEPVRIYGAKKDNGYLMTWAYAIHVGNWGGIWTKILAFTAALIGASLPVTGYLLWRRKH